MCSCATFINIYFKLIIFLKLFAPASQYDVTIICLIRDCLQNSFARGYWNRCAAKVYTGGKILQSKTKWKTPNWAKFCSRFTLPPAWSCCIGRSGATPGLLTWVTESQLGPIIWVYLHANSFKPPNCSLYETSEGKRKNLINK